MSIKAKIDDILKKLNPHQLKTIKIKPQPTKPEHIWSSKFGGTPYWPIDKKYPTAISGKPLFLLAQLNLSEMPQLEGYPTTGILQFFILNDEMFGLELDRSLSEILSSPHGYQVIYHPAISKDGSAIQSNLPQITEKSHLPISGEYALEFQLTTELPSPTDYRFDEIIENSSELDDEVSNYLFDTLDASGSKLGGYANFTQDDPRWQENKDNWLLLFQMDSEYSGDIDIMWGDAGVGNFFIKPEALSQCNFSEVWYNWDCC